MIFQLSIACFQKSHLGVSFQEGFIKVFLFLHMWFYLLAPIPTINPFVHWLFLWELGQFVYVWVSCLHKQIVENTVIGKIYTFFRTFSSFLVSSYFASISMLGFVLWVLFCSQKMDGNGVGNLLKWFLSSNTIVGQYSLILSKKFRKNKCHQILLLNTMKLDIRIYVV